MAGKQTTATSIPVSVAASDKALNYLKQSSGNGDVGATLSRFCTYWLENQAGGGLLLEPADHDYLADLHPDKKRFRDSRSLVRAVEKGMKREEGQFTFQIAVDPAHIPALKDTAENGGLTVEEAITGIVQHIFASGMIYDFTPDQGRSIPFTYQMLVAVKEALDKQYFDSSDIAGMVAENRFVPVTREVAKLAKELTGKVDFTPQDIGELLVELAELRKNSVATVFTAA